MSHCFVIQPFDDGVFDNRYEDVFAPAIKEAGLEPYRVDRDPSVSIPIQEIEAGIKDARICLADISLDNPNVWFELGFAIASSKEVILVCSDQRQTRFPFDVQHRSIIKYKTGAPRDFAALKNSIKTRIDALMQKAETLIGAADVSRLQKIEGLEQNEVVALAAIGENISTSTDVAPVYQIRSDMENSGFTKLATTMALHTLAKRGLILACTIGDSFDPDAGYSLTDEGWEWILANKHLFVLQTPPKANSKVNAPDYSSFDDDIPF